MKTSCGFHTLSTLYLTGRTNKRYLVTSPVSLVRSWSPVLPTTACCRVLELRKCCGPADWSYEPLLVIRQVFREAMATHKKLIYVHARVHSDLSAKIVVELGFLERLRRLICQELCKPLRSRFRLNTKFCS